MSTPAPADMENRFVYEDKSWSKLEMEQGLQAAGCPKKLSKQLVAMWFRMWKDWQQDVVEFDDFAEWIESHGYRLGIKTDEEELPPVLLHSLTTERKWTIVCLRTVMQVPYNEYDDLSD